MNILFASQRGDSLGVAQRCASEGYTISFYTEDEAAAFVGDGLVGKVDFAKHLINRRGECVASNVLQLLSETQPDLVVFDDGGMGRVADYIREKNIPVVGSSYWSDFLSTSSDYTLQVLKRLKMEGWRGEKGVKVECGAWWNGLSLLSPFLAYNEDRFMTEALGQRVSSAGNIVHFLPSSSSLYSESIGKMERLLKKSKFRGVISMSCVVTRGKVWVHHFTTSSLFIPTLLEVYKGSVTDLLLGVASGRKFDGQFTSDYALSILLSIPPYPSTSPACTRRVKGISPSNLKHIHLLDICHSGETYETAGASGKVMWVSARGRDVREAAKRAYKTVSNLSISDVQYRTDIGRRVELTEDILKGQKYI